MDNLWEAAPLIHRRRIAPTQTKISVRWHKYVSWYIGILKPEEQVKATKKIEVSVLHLLATNLKRLREEAGLNQSEMAAALDKFQDYVSRVEAGKINLTAKTLQAYVDALDIAPQELLKPTPTKR